MVTITKKNITNKVAEKLEIRDADVRIVVQEFLDRITGALVDGDRCEFRDFGVFEIVIRKAKVGRNPKVPGVSIPIPAHNEARFSPGKVLKALVENSKAKTPSKKKQ